MRFVLALALLLAAVPAAATTLKLATWNMEWLTLRPANDPALPADVHPRAPGDFDRLRAYADRLDADIVAFQEVDGAAAATRVFDPARYQIVTTAQNVVQRVGLAVKRGIAILRQADVAALDVVPEAPHPLRDGLDATLALPGGTTLRLLVVHLKSGCAEQPLSARRRACRELARQVPVLAAWAASRQAEHIPYALLGDFNRVLDEPDPLTAALAAAARLTRVTEGASNPCWGGDAFIDHLFLGGAARDWLVPGSLRVLVWRETGREWRARLSDHCPVSVRLAVPTFPGPAALPMVPPPKQGERPWPIPRTPPPPPDAAGTSKPMTGR